MIFFNLMTYGIIAGVFQFIDNITDDYSRLISIYDSRISETVEKEIKERLLWPESLIQINTLVCHQR